MTPARLLPILRRAALLLALAGGVYLFVRFDGRQLPPDSQSPLLRFNPGDHLVVDRYPGGLGLSDAVLFAGPDGRVHLAEVRELRAREGRREYWLGHDAPGSPAPDSERLGWIDEDWIRARVIMLWPW